MAPENRSGGGENQELIARMAALEKVVENINQSLSGKLDVNKVTQSTAVTEPGFAVDARELNPMIDGIAKDVFNIKESQNKIAQKISGKIFTDFDSGNSEWADMAEVSIPADGVWMVFGKITMEGNDIVGTLGPVDASLQGNIFGGTGTLHNTGVDNWDRIVLVSIQKGATKSKLSFIRWFEGEIKIRCEEICAIRIA